MGSPSLKRITIADRRDFMWLRGPWDCVRMRAAEGVKSGRASFRNRGVGELCVEILLQVRSLWHEAHVKHDARALESLYAPRVTFYGQSLTAKQCVSRKQSAFAKDPSYTQAVAGVWSAERDAGAQSLTVVRFDKTSTSKGKSTHYPSTLVLDRARLIVSESDDVTETNLQSLAAAAAAWCTNNRPDLFDAVPNDQVIAPYKLSALDVWRRVPDSKYFKDLVAANHDDFLVLDIIQCPTKCDRSAHDCGYTMRVGNHGHPDRFPFLVDWVYIDAVDGTIWFDDNKKSEPLPPLSSPSTDQ